MTIEPEFADMMVDTVTIEPFLSGSNFYSTPSYGPAVTYKARVVRENRQVRTDQGEEAVSRTHAYIFGAPGIKAADRATLADGSHPPIMTVDSYPDENGPHHEIVFFGGG